MAKRFSKNKPRKEPKERFLFELILSITLLLVMVLVIGTGVLSYFRLNQIILTVSSGIRPDQKLILVKEILNNLTEAENSVKSYSLLRNEEDMSRFYGITEETGNKMDELLALGIPGDTMSFLIDTLDRLVERKFLLLDQYLFIQDEYRVQQAMKEVMQRIREKEQPAEVATADTTDQKNGKKKDNFFTRLFTRKDRKGKKDRDTIPEVPPADQASLLDEISSEVKAIQQEALVRERTLRQEEWDLLQQDRLVGEQIRKVIATMELIEAKNLSISTLDAEEKVGEVKAIIMAFVISASLLLMMAALVIWRYVRWNNDYRRALKLARNEAMELARAKEQFLATISHEIRTPMNVISGFTGQLLKGRLEEEQRDQLGMVKKSSDHLLHVMNDLLDLSRLQAGKLELQETDFSPAGVVNDVRDMLAPVATEKNIEFLAWNDPAFPELVHGDPVRLRQILLNLTSNAIKFTDQGKVTLRAFPGDSTDEDPQCIFEVTDTGIGISESDLERIFEEFEQARETAGRQKGGAGLGLAITQKLIELHSGRLKVKSRAGEGSVFRAEIPYRRAKRDKVPGQAMTAAATRSLDGIKVLVVDDEEYNRRLMRAVLGKQGCTVVEAGSGEEALQMIGNHPVDVILMDLRLPGMSGTEASQEISRITTRRGKKIPVIVVSAAISPDSLEDFRKNGIDGLVPKPFEEDHLVQTILSVLSAQEPAYDLNPLKEASDGDPRFVGEMIRLFIRDTTRGFQEIHTCLDAKEWDKAADIVHRISPPCHHLKAGRLYSLLKEAEQLLRTAGKHAQAAETIRQANNEFDRIAEDISKQTDRKQIP